MLKPDLSQTEDLAALIDASPSPRLACKEVARRLTEAGFHEIHDRDSWDNIEGGWFVRRAGSLHAGFEPANMDKTRGFRLLGAHTDSPNLRLKPKPDSGRVGYRQLGIEVYGGALLNSWLDRDLGISGTVWIDGDNQPSPLDFHLDEPLLRVPQLAIHLHRELRTEGLKLNAQTHMTPVFGLGKQKEGDFQEWLCERLEIDPKSALSFEIMTHDLTPSRLTGPNREFLSAPRLDNLLSTWAATMSLLNCAKKDLERATVITLFDHEEVGSSSRSGAQGPHLRHILERLILQRGGNREDYLRALADSVCVSADMAHAVHPNYADKHDPHHQVAINAGPVIKVNQNMRYASEGETQALFEQACRTADVPFQKWSMRSDLACGSTIGPLTAMNLGIGVVDVGCPQLAMHSAREFAGSADPGWMVAAMTTFCQN